MYECLGKYLINTFRDLNFRLHIQTKVLIVLYQNYPGRIKNCKFLIFKVFFLSSHEIDFCTINWENNKESQYYFLIAPISEAIHFSKILSIFVDSLDNLTYLCFKDFTLNWKRKLMVNFTDYGRPMKPFFIKIKNFWAWADKLDR